MERRSGPFAKWGRLMYRHRWPVIGLWLAMLLCALPFLPQLPRRLSAGGFSDPRLPSAQADATLQRDLGLSLNTAAVFYTSHDRPYADPAVRGAVAASLGRIQELPNVTSVLPPDLNTRQIGRSGKTVYALVSLSGRAEDSLAALPELEQRAAVPSASGEQIDVLVAGGATFLRDLQLATERDLRQAELVSLPVALVALALVFGSLSAAGVPVVVGAATTALGLAVIYALSFPLQLSIFGLNLASMLGLGLGTDYALFLVSRYREELSGGASPARAVETTIATAGRAVFFSAGTVLVGLSGLVAFRFMFLRSLGVAGITAVLAAVLAALTLLPAILGVMGARVNSFRLPKLQLLLPVALHPWPSTHSGHPSPPSPLPLRGEGSTTVRRRGSLPPRPLWERG
jgi:RND superfamily putative drug exporter